MALLVVPVHGLPLYRWWHGWSTRKVLHTKCPQVPHTPDGGAIMIDSTTGPLTQVQLG